MKTQKTIMISLLLVQFQNPALADANNYNSNANSNANSNGVNNSNCHSALVMSCDSISAGPAPILGGGLGSLLITTVAFVLKRKNKKHI